MSNEIGRRGENIFSTIISRYVSDKGFLFYPTFLGDKFTVMDFYVDLLHYPMKRAFFFASVKCTTLGYFAGNERLKIFVDKGEVAELKKLAVPVYLFGIDEKAEKGYFVCGNNLDSTAGVNGIPTKYDVDGRNIELLWQEVADYWDRNKEITKFVSHFK